jgi:hypothetical protein
MRCGFEEIGIKHVVVIHEDQQLSSSLADSTQPRGSETKLLFPNQASL